MDSLGRNITLPIYNANGTSFHGLELKKFTFDSVVMALGDKITGELYYPSNTLSVNQTEYVVYDGVKYYLINPPTIVKEGMKADNGTAKGMTKYSFTFYHPMFMLYNFPFTDVAVTSSEEKYKSQDKNFFWIGNLVDYVAKLNKNLTETEWVVEIGSNVPVQDKNKLSEVLSFNDQKIADALKTGYDTWEIPYIIDIIASTDSRYAQGKRFLIRYGLPSQEILVENAQHQLVPYVFQMGQGVGLKNDSRTPKNNKIVTRIAGYGSEDNVPFGYPQIIWTGDQTWNYTINNSASAANSYPIYDGIVAGQRVRLIHHPFTRSHLMPTIYADTVNKKVNPYATGYDPTIEIKDYYDAVNDGTWNYPNQIIQNAPSYEIHEFSDIKPELGEKYIGGASAFDGDVGKKYLTVQEGLDQIMDYVSETNIDVERQVLKTIYDKVNSGTSGSGSQEDVRYTFSYVVSSDTNFINVKLVSNNINFTMEIHRTNSFPSAPWDDSMDDDGNYKQSYFNIILPSLGFDVYACAAVTQEMKINMRSGACIGCSFPVQVDWEDYKKNFYDSDGNFAPTGPQRDYTKYPDSTSSSITVICKKELETFGTLMPNIYQQPAANDKFVILGISLPQSYITSAQTRLDNDMKQYMLDNNVHYFEYPLKFDEYFLANHTNILAQMKPNILVRFNFASEQHELYIKQISVKYGEKTLPQYNITLTDDIEIILSPIGRVTDEVSSLRVLLGGGGGGGDVSLDMLSEYFLSKKEDDTAAGMIRLLRGLQVGENFVTGLLGEGGIFRVDEDGTTYLEADKLYIRMRAYFDTVEVKKYLHSVGNRIASKAGINCSRVEWIDANGDVTNVLEDVVKFRCYFRATGDDGHKITNDFVVNDLAFCEETNVDTTSVDQHGYWRCVIAVSSSPTEDGEHWIDLSKTDCQTDSDVPIAQDDIVQLGHKTDTTRQGAIIEYVGGEDAPAYQIYQGINTYSLVGKNYVRFGYDSQSGGAQAYIGNPDGSTYLWYHRVNGTPQLDIKANVKMTSPYTSQETDLEAFAAAVKANEDDLQSQIDGEIDTWFYEGTPTLSNAPAVDWNTVALKERHLGDLYYDVGTGQTAGFAYRFIKTTSGGVDTYSWQYIEDTAITEALRIASEAKDTADNKRRVFLTTPTPPYDAGDLWANAVYPSNYTGDTDESQHKYNNDLLRCITAKAEGGTFSINDWQLASKYTDNSALLTFLDGYQGTLTQVQEQIDQKAETWYQDADPSTAWTTDDIKAEHVGDIWCDTSANGGKKTYIYQSRTSGGTTTYYWSEQAVPDSVFDEIDGKTAIYTAWGVWDVPTGSPTKRILQVKDLFIPSSDTTQGGTAYKANKVYRCTAVGTFGSTSPAFQEVSYTDDTTVNAIISKYGEILGITPDATGVGEALGKLRKVLGSSTEISGGLVLTNIIYMKDTETTPSVRAGISGLYQSTETGTGYKGYGTAAWFGGGVYNGVPIDKEVSGTSGSYANYAKSLFRFDGSGYVAHGNLTWDKNGNVTIQGYSINATTLQSGGSNVATEAMLANYVTLNSAQTITGLKTFNNKIKIGDVYLEWESANNALKVYKMSGSSVAAVNLYATGGVSAFGLSTSGGGVTLNQPLASINNLNANPTSANKTLVWTGSEWTYGSVGSGAVSSITVGSTNYSPVGGVVTLPNYPSKVSDLTNDSGFITNSALSGYLPLTGGTLTGALTINYNTTYPLTIIGSNSYSLIHFTPRDTSGGNYIVDIGLHMTNLCGYIAFGKSTYCFLSVDNSNAYYSDSSSNYRKYTLLHSGNIGSYNAGSATKLETARTLWGRSFDGTANVNGEINMTLASANTIKAISSMCSSMGSGNNMYFILGQSESEGNSGAIVFTYKGSNDADNTLNLGMYSNHKLLNIHNSGNVGVGTDSPSYKLDVNGTFGVTGATTLSSTLSVASGITLTTTKRIYFGDSSHYIELNSTGFHFSHGLYSDSFVSAFGASTSSGGITLNQPLASINNINANPSSSNKTLVWNGSAWTYADLGSGSVSSVVVNGTSYSSVNGVVTLPNYPTKVSDLTNDSGFITNSALSGYLPLTGGTLTGALTINYNTTYPLVLRGTENDDKQYTVINFKDRKDNSSVTDIGWLNDIRGDLTYMANLSSVGIISCDNSGAYYSNSTSTFKKYTIYHSGNLSPLTTTNYATTLGSVYHPYGGSTSIGFLTNDFTVDVGTSANKLHICSASFSWDGSTSYPLIYSQPVRFSKDDRYTMIAMPHLPFLENSKRGYIGTTYGAIVRMESATSNPTYWDMGIPATDTFQIKRASTSMFVIKNTGCLYTTTTYNLASVWKNAIAWGSDSYNKAVIGYLDSDIKGVVLGAHNAALNQWAPLYVSGSTLYLCTSQTVHMYINNSGNVGIGTTSPSYKLHVNGTFYADSNSSIGGTLGVTGATTLSSTLSVAGNTTPSATGTYNLGSSSLYWNYTYTNRLYLASGVYFVKDSNGVRLVGAGFYSDSFVSAFGASSGGGSLTLNEPLTSINSASLGAASVAGQTLVYNGSAWKYSNTSGVTLKADKLYASTGITIANGNLNISLGNISLPGYVHSYGNIITNSKIAIGYNDVSSSYQFYCKNNGYISGTLTQGSDIRRKNIIGDVDTLDIDAIAGAPFFKFQWRDSDDDRIYAGTSAQYWQLCLPETVLPTGDGYLSMDYGVTALISTIITARKVVDHEKRIAELEAENEILRREINELKAA